MIKIGIIICGRYITCGGGKCLKALKERVGGFTKYPKEEELELVGFSNCGGCPGGNIENAPAEMIKNGAEVIHFATGMVVGYPPCQFINQFKEFVENQYKIPVVIGTHPIPLKYFNAHNNLSFWKEMEMDKISGELLIENKEIMSSYD